LGPTPFLFLTPSQISSATGKSSTGGSSTKFIRRHGVLRRELVRPLRRNIRCNIRNDQRCRWFSETCTKVVQHCSLSGAVAGNPAFDVTTEMTPTSMESQQLDHMLEQKSPHYHMVLGEMIVYFQLIITSDLSVFHDDL